jgi:hypothetical protein
MPEHLPLSYRNSSSSPKILHYIQILGTPGKLKQGIVYLVLSVFRIVLKLYIFEKII